MGVLSGSRFRPVFLKYISHPYSPSISHSVPLVKDLFLMMDQIVSIYFGQSTTG